MKFKKGDKVEVLDDSIRGEVLKVESDKIIIKTEDEFEVSVGTVAIFHMMQAVEGKYWEYEEGERKAWKTWHQQQVDNNTKGSWKFNRIMMPSDNHASHITVNMFKNWDQRYMESPSGPKLSASTRRALNKGVLAREVKNVYHVKEISHLSIQKKFIST